MKLENESQTNNKIRGYFGTIASMAIAGMITAAIMLITTNQTTNHNSEQIERMDERQRAMQVDLQDISTSQEAQAKSLDRIESLIERYRNEGTPR